MYTHVYIKLLKLIARWIDDESACLLGAPLLRGLTMDHMLESKCVVSQRAMYPGHTGSPVILNNITSVSCTDHPSLVKFDGILRLRLSSIVNCNLCDMAWVQASLPIHNGGLGICSVALLASSAFLASAASTSNLQSDILAGIELVVWTVERWSELFNRIGSY